MWYTGVGQCKRLQHIILQTPTLHNHTVWTSLGVCRFTRAVVQKRRALISQQREAETQGDFTRKAQRRKDFVDIILLTKVEERKKEA